MLCQESNLEGFHFQIFPYLYQMFLSKLSIAEKFKDMGKENLVNLVGNQFPIDIVSHNLDINRKTEDCFHKLNVNLNYNAFVLKDSSGEEKYLPSARSFFIRVKNLINNHSIC